MRVSRFAIASLILSVSVAGFALAKEATPESTSPFVGFWYGVGEPDDPSISYIDSYHADGTFNSEFRKCEKGEVVWRQTESGKWTIMGSVLRMVSNIIDGKKTNFDNSYVIESSTRDEFHARLHNPDYLFIERRIPKFEFPPCYVGA
ncbi:MAG TPA: hypothetical protein VNH44_05370 [Micropepsaceae bacterium]|nr:hypothetical protein [Micropepsaceae bacterium]